MIALSSKMYIFNFILKKRFKGFVILDIGILNISDNNRKANTHGPLPYAVENNTNVVSAPTK